MTKITNTCPKIPLVLLTLALSGCAHSYFYTPEIAGEGARVGRGGIVFQIPPQAPLLKMKLVTLGVVDAPPEAKAPGNSKMVRVRMLFVRASQGSDTPVRINPSDMKFAILDESPTLPALVQGLPHQGSALELVPAQKQAVDFWFPLAKANRGARDIQAFTLAWKISYGSGSSEQQITRFDRGDNRPQEGSDMFPWDADFPYDMSPVLPPGWAYEPGPFWTPFPFWP